MLIYSSVTSCVPCVLMKSALVNHDISCNTWFRFYQASVFPSPTNLPTKTRNKPGFISHLSHPDLSAHCPLPTSGILGFGVPYYPVPPVSSFPTPFVFARVIFRLAMSPPTFLSINFSLPVSCFVIPRSFSNRALLKFLFESLWLWRPSYARGRNCTRYWVTQSQMIRKQHVLLSLRTSFPSIRCSTQNHITSAFN